MADNDRKHQKRLKEAQRTWDKFTKSYKDGKISSEDLKAKLRPYKAELVELGLVKGDKKEQPPAEPEKSEAPAVGASAKPVVIRAEPWSRRSNLTLEEVRHRTDLIGSTGPSESLKETYRMKFGEDLPRPSDDVVFEVSQRTEAPAGDEGVLETGEEDREPISERSKGFLRSLFNKGKGE